MKLKLPPTAVEIIIAEDLKGHELAAYFQLNFIEFGALVVELTGNNKKGIKEFAELMVESFYRGASLVELTGNNKKGIKEFAELMVESFYRGAEDFSKDQLDKPDNGKLASILITPTGKLQ